MPIKISPIQKLKAEPISSKYEFLSEIIKKIVTLKTDEYIDVTFSAPFPEDLRNKMGTKFYQIGKAKNRKFGVKSIRGKLNKDKEVVFRIYRYEKA